MSNAEMQNALIVAHGQPSDPEPAEVALRLFARKVQAAASTVQVHSATLAAPGRLEAVLAELPDSTVIYPLFMAKGWFVTSALPKRLDDRAITILDPFGIDPALPNLAANVLRRELGRLGWTSGDTDLLVAAHGSGRSRNPSQVAQAFAAQMDDCLAFNAIHLGFVEEEPSIAHAARLSGHQSLCLPFFACTGGHMIHDVPQALRQGGFHGHLLPVLGELDPVPAHIGKTLMDYFAAR